MGDEPATGANAAPAGKSKLMPIIIVAALMIGEGVGIYFVAKALHTGPDIAAAGQGGRRARAGGRRRDGAVRGCPGGGSPQQQDVG